MKVWPFPPQGKVKEKLEWATDVIRCIAAEQRIALRPEPRVALSLSYQFKQSEVEAATTMARKYTQDDMLMPMWPDLVDVGDVTGAQATLTGTFTHGRFVDGGVVLVIGRDNSFELVNVVTVTDDTLTLADPYVLHDHDGAFAIPCFVGKLSTALTINKRAADYSQGEMGLLATEPMGVTPGHNFPTFEDTHVMTRRAVVSGSMRDKTTREVTPFTNVAGPLHYSTKYAQPSLTSVLSFSMDTPPDVAEFRKWLYAVRGRQLSFFVPSWVRAYQPTRDIEAVDDRIFIAKNSYEENTLDGPLCIVQHDGTITPFRPTSVVSSGATEDRFMLTAPIGSAIPLSSIEMICRMPRMRLDADKVEIGHMGSYKATCNIPVREVQA